MPLFGRREPNPSTAPKSLGGIFKESLFGTSRTTPKPEQKPQARPESKGLFGKQGYASFQEQRGFARKAPYEPLPGTARRLGKEERLGLIRDLQERSKAIGQYHGLSEQTYKERILPQLRKEKYQLHIAGKYNEEKALERRMQQYEKWIKGA